MHISIIGLGLMGRAMSQRLLAAGYRVSGYDIVDAANETAAQLGVDIAPSAAEAIAESQTILLSLMTSQNRRELLWGEQQGADSLPDGALVLDTTTARPQDIQDDATRLLKQRNVRLVDVCLSGSSQAVSEGRALALIGDREDSAEYREILKTFTAAQYFLGLPGRGNAAKLIVNLVFGLNRIVLAEALGLARGAGFELSTVLEILQNGETYSTVMDTKGPKMIAGQYEPPVARLSQHAKDVRLILDFAKDLHVNVPLSEVHSAMIEKLIELGHGELDNAAIFKAYD